MEKIQPWMRLKVKADTFVLPDMDGQVYFRNNEGSFRMGGTAIQAWIEQLLPVFDGENTLESLADGLPKPYQDRICEIAGILYENGFLRDVSTDQPHQLPSNILHHFASQIEFIDHAVGSGAHHFERYRNVKMLAIGSGPILLALVHALLESGSAAINLMVTDPDASLLSGLDELVQLYEPLHPFIAIQDLTHQTQSPDALQSLVHSMDAVLYVSQTGDLDALSRIESICRQGQKPLLSAVCLERMGLVVPMSGGPDFTTVWRRIHRAALEPDLQVSGVSGTSGAVLANVLVFEYFKSMTGVERAGRHRFYTLNLETLEGAWHDVIPAVREAGEIRPIRVESTESRALSDVLSSFTRLTDKTSGIFHTWDEGDLVQLPLSVCRVQPIDPLSTGPADLLPETVCLGFTHDDARCEAGLTGIEAYVQRWVPPLASDTNLAVGAGLTLAEAICRGLTHRLAREVRRSLADASPIIRAIQLGELQDEKCQFYWNALCAGGHEPHVGLCDDAFGFPVVWMGIRDLLIGSVGLCFSVALQKALAYGIAHVSGSDAGLDTRAVFTTSAGFNDASPVSKLDVPAWSGFDNGLVASAMDQIHRSGREVAIFNLAIEPFLTDVLASVVGISIRQGGLQ